MAFRVNASCQVVKTSWLITHFNDHVDQVFGLLQILNTILVHMTADELAELNPLDYRKVALGIWESFRKETSFDESKN